MPKLSPTEAAAKWARRASQASGDYVDGIERVQVSPGQLAARKGTKWLQNTQAAHQKFVTNVARVGLEPWKARTREVGGPRYAQGVQASETKMAEALNRVFPVLDRVTAETRSMPDTTFEQRAQRALAQMTKLHQAFKGGQPGQVT